MITASSAFLEPQHSFPTPPGIATGTLTFARKRSSRSVLATKISVDASKTNIMTRYYKRNCTTEDAPEMFGLGSVAWNACPVGDSDELRSGFRCDRDQRSGLTPISRQSRLK